MNSAAIVSEAQVHTPVYARYTHLSVYSCTHKADLHTDSPPSLACHEEAIIQLEPRVKNTQDTTMIRVFPFPLSAGCSGDRGAETGPHFRHVMTRPLLGGTSVMGRGAAEPRTPACWVWYKGNRLPNERFQVLDPSDVGFTCLTQALAC